MSPTDGNYGTEQRWNRRSVLQGAGATIGVATMTLAACNRPSTTASPAASPAAAAPGASAGPAVANPKYGGAIKVMSTGGERTLDPHMSSGAAGGIGAAICYSQLLTYQWGTPDIKPPSYLVTGDVADSWTQPDDLTYLFKLRSGVRFHNIAPVNGRELVAEDLVFTFQRIQDLKVYSGLLAGVSKLEAVDKATFKLTMSQPNADILLNLAEATGMEIVAREQVDAQGDLTAPPVIGTGAWIFEDFKPSQYFFANRNPDYFAKGTPYADRYEGYRTTDPSNVLNGFKSGAINVVGNGMYGQSGEELVKAVPSATVHWILLNRSPSEMWLNTKFETFADRRVRQAIHKAIDRKAIIDSVLLGHGIFSTGIITPTAGGKLPEAELTRLMTRDVAGAKALLREAGKESFEFEAVTANYLQNAYVAFAELIQANLKEVGINMKITVVDSATLSQRQNSGNFQASIGAGGGGTANSTLLSRYLATGPTNYAGFDSPETERLIHQQAPMSRDPAGRLQILQEIQRKVIDEAVYINLHEYHQPTMAGPEIKGFLPPTGISAHNGWPSTLWFDR